MGQLVTEPKEFALHTSQKRYSKIVLDKDRMLSKPSVTKPESKYKKQPSKTVPLPFKLSETRDLSEKSMKSSAKEFVSLKTKISKFFQEETYSSCRSSTKKYKAK